MKNIAAISLILGVAFVAAVGCGEAWASNAQLVAEAVPPSGQVTVTTETTPTAPSQEGTVVKETTRTVNVRHEAVMDAAGNIIESTIVKTAPPEPRTEVMRVETRPAENAVWIPGYWQWDSGKASYDWVPGTWRRAIPGMTWNAGHWVAVANGYEWSPGFWTSGTVATAATGTTTTQKIVARETPPVLKEETRPAAPSADVVWIPGYWTYDKGAYVWTSGRWERPASENMIWTAPRWVHRATGYEFLPGHWDYPVETRTYVVKP